MVVGGGGGVLLFLLVLLLYVHMHARLASMMSCRHADVPPYMHCIHACVHACVPACIHTYMEAGTSLGMSAYLEVMSIRTYM